MSQLNLPRLFLSAILCLTFSRAATAQSITNTTPIIAGGSTNQVLSGGLFVGASFIEPWLEYFDNSPIDLQITVDAPGRYQISEAPQFGLVQNLGSTNWVGFEADLVSSPAGSSFAFLTGPDQFNLSQFLDYSNTFPIATLSNGNLTASFSGGSVAAGSSFQPLLTFQASAAGTYDIRQFPIAVPEPATFWLFSAGALILLRRRHQHA